MLDSKAEISECPKCGSNLSDKWVVGRMLQQGCYECGWVGIKRVPETRPIKNFKDVKVSNFQGYHFEMFDRYGHTLMFSRSYNLREDAIADLKLRLARCNTNPDISPCTGILWPDTVKVEGEVIT